MIGGGEPIRLKILENPTLYYNESNKLVLNQFLLPRNSYVDRHATNN